MSFRLLGSHTRSDKHKEMCESAEDGEPLCLIG